LATAFKEDLAFEGLLSIGLYTPLSWWCAFAFYTGKRKEMTENFLCAAPFVSKKRGASRFFTYEEK